MGWTAPVQTPIEKGEFVSFVVTTDDFGWISSFMPFGAIAGAVITASLVDLVGRKGLILILTVPCIIGWASIAFSISVSNSALMEITVYLCILKVISLFQNFSL